MASELRVNGRKPKEPKANERRAKEPKASVHKANGRREKTVSGTKEHHKEKEKKGEGV